MKEDWTDSDKQALKKAMDRIGNALEHCMGGPGLRADGEAQAQALETTALEGAGLDGYRDHRRDHLT